MTAVTKDQALQAFWESFGLPAYEESSVPPGAVFPYITYQFVSDSFGASVALSASVWYQSTRWKEANAKAEEISAAIGRGGIFLDYDGGAIWLQRGQPFSQSMGDPQNQKTKRKILNLVAEYWSAN